MLDALSGLGGMAGGGGLSASSSAKTGDLYEAPRTTTVNPTFGVGNRGFINNFAGSGAQLSSDESINPPKTAGDYVLYSVVAIVALGFVAVAVWALRK